MWYDTSEEFNMNWKAECDEPETKNIKKEETETETNAKWMKSHWIK